MTSCKEIKRLLDTAIYLKKEDDSDGEIYNIAEMLRKEIRELGNTALKKAGTKIAIFDNLFYECLENDSDYLITLLPVFDLLCRGEIDWAFIKNLKNPV